MFLNAEHIGKCLDETLVIDLVGSCQRPIKIEHGKIHGQKPYMCSGGSMTLSCQSSIFAAVSMLSTCPESTMSLSTAICSAVRVFSARPRCQLLNSLILEKLRVASVLKE